MRIRLDSPARGRGSCLVYLALFALVLPNLIWVLLDRGPWISDTSYYGFEACRLYDASREGPRRWVVELLGVPFKPPLVPWLGQLFVPLGRALGDVDGGLLLLPVGSSFAALLFLHRALRALGHPCGVTWAGSLALAAAPVFAEVTTKLYAQPLQLAAVCWLILIMVRAEAWPPARTALQLAAAGSAAMLTTLSSPVFCAVPVLVAAAAMVRAARRRPHGPDSSPTLLWLAGGSLLLVGLTLAWYARNYRSALAYASWAYDWLHGSLVSSADDSTSRIVKLGVWLKLLAWDMWLKPGLVSCLLILTGAAVGSRTSAPRGPRLSWMVLVLQFALLLAVFSSARSQDYYYLLPAVPFAALALAEGLSRAGRGWLTGALLALLSAQWAAVHLDRLGLVAPSSRFQRLQRGRDARFDLMDLVVRLGRRAPSRTILLATGTLGIYNLDVQYHAVKRGDDRGPWALYESVESLLLGSFETGEASRSQDQVWQRIQALRPAYVIVLDEQSRRAERSSDRWRGAGSWRDVLMSALDVSERIAAGPGFRRSAVAEHPGLEFYEPQDAAP